MQADKITIYEAQNKMIAEGNVVFDQGNDQRITGSKAEWNYKTKLGYFVDSTGFTNQTSDGTVIYFTADRVERISLDTIVVHNGKFTACEDAVPKWSFTAKEATIKTKDKVKFKNPKFRILDIPVIPLPYASIPINEQDRASGFLTPTFGYSGKKESVCPALIIKRSAARSTLLCGRTCIRRAAWVLVSTFVRGPTRVRSWISDFLELRTGYSGTVKTRSIPTRAVPRFTPTACTTSQTDLPRRWTFACIPTWLSGRSFPKVSSRSSRR
jgi:hypothetical protein